jgi:hypothetical protein
MVWTTIGLIGMNFGIRNIISSKRDIAALRKMNGHNVAKYQPMKIIAYGHYRNDMFRLAKHGTITMIGILSMIIPPTSAGTITPVGLVITVGLFTISIMLVMASALDRRQREVLEDLE